MSKIKRDSFYMVYNWMMTELGLAKTNLIIFAIMYGFSRDGHTCHASVKYLSEISACSERGVQTSIKFLLGKEMIENVGKKAVKGGYVNEYRVNDKTIDYYKLHPCKKCTPAKNADVNANSAPPKPFSGANSAPNNKEYNKEVKESQVANLTELLTHVELTKWLKGKGCKSGLSGTIDGVKYRRVYTPKGSDILIPITTCHPQYRDKLNESLLNCENEFGVTGEEIANEIFKSTVSLQFKANKNGTMQDVKERVHSIKQDTEKLSKKEKNNVMGQFDQISLILSTWAELANKRHTKILKKDSQKRKMIKACLQHEENIYTAENIVGMLKDMRLRWNENTVMYDSFEISTLFKLYDNRKAKSEYVGHKYYFKYMEAHMEREANPAERKRWERSIASEKGTPKKSIVNETFDKVDYEKTAFEWGADFE